MVISIRFIGIRIRLLLGKKIIMFLNLS